MQNYKIWRIVVELRTRSTLKVVELRTRKRQKLRFNAGATAWDRLQRPRVAACIVNIQASEEQAVKLLQHLVGPLIIASVVLFGLPVATTHAASSTAKVRVAHAISRNLIISSEPNWIQ